MNVLENLLDFSKYIKSSPPLDEDFDIKRIDSEYSAIFSSSTASFQQNFYSLSIYEPIAIELNIGIWKFKPKGPFMLFQLPHQMITWKVEPGYVRSWHILFTENFLLKHRQLTNIVQDFPFLQVDKDLPIEIGVGHLMVLEDCYKKIQKEYDANLPDSFQLIASYLYTFLLQVKRLHNEMNTLGNNQTEIISTNDQFLVNRFLAILDQENDVDDECDECSVTYFAKALAVHPNHLNAVVKKVTGKTPQMFIQDRVIHLAKTLLLQTPLSIKEISYKLYFAEPTHFGAYFKKYTGYTPLQFRKLQQI